MLHAVIMAGGSGTRFWPESRTARPKQLLPITGNKAMLVETIERLKPLVPLERIWVVTNAAQVNGIKECCPQLPKSNILVEPCARNTSACVGLAAIAIEAIDKEATMAVFPADHLIEPKESFQESIQIGQAIAEEGRHFVTFGIIPDYPATGYGYIKQGELYKSTNNIKCYQVDSFKEKPNEETAKSFLKKGNYLWNAGIFIWKAQTILEAISEKMPDLHLCLENIKKHIGKESFQDNVNAVYPTMPSLPVDIGIMEKVSGVHVLAAPYKWSDIGSWRALYDEVERDEDGNAQVFADGGQLLAEEAKNILAYSSSKHNIAVLGLDDIVVVHTEDVTLVAPRDRSEDVKVFVEQLKKSNQQSLL